jgi:carbon monoxide dehydrogenase subunit G
LEINGERKIPAPQHAVWNALNDPLVLRECIPGCDQMEKVSDTEYRLGMLAVVGPVKARFSGKLMLSDIVEPQGYALQFEGSGGAAGFGKGSARVALSSIGETETQLDYTASAQVGGKLAQVGSRLIDGIARKIAEDFFTRFNALVTSTQAAAADSAVPAGDAAPANDASENPTTPQPATAATSTAHAASPIKQDLSAATPVPRKTFKWSSIAIVVVVVLLGMVVLHFQK